MLANKAKQEWSVSWSGFIETSDDDVGVEEHLDALMNEIDDRDLSGPAVHIDLKERSVKLFIEVEADDEVDAVATAKQILQEVIHEAGGATPDWSDGDTSSWSVRLVSGNWSAVEKAAA